MKKTLHATITLLALSATLLLSKANAQTVSWQWASGAGSTGGEMVMGTAYDANGYLYTVGWYSSASITFGSITLTNPGNFTADIFVVKYDPAGNVIWAKSYGGTDGDLGNGITVDASGNVYITGWYTSANLTMGSHTVTNTSTGNSEIFIAKINSAGTTQWLKSVGGTTNERGYGITCDASGNVFVTGGFGSPSVNFGSGSLTNSGTSTQDFFIAKYDAAGTSLWAKSAGGTSSEMGYSAACDSLGNVYVTGVFSSASVNFGSGAVSNAATGTQDIFVVKYNGSGTAAWAARAGGSQDDFGNAIAVKGTGVYVTGGFNSTSLLFGSTTLTNAMAGTSDIFVARYDLSGASVWARKSGGADSEAGNGIAADSAGNIYLTGYFISSSISFGSITINDFSVGYRDLYVASYNNAGTPLWATAVGSTYDETSNAISVGASSAHVYIGGTFNSGVVSFGAHNVLKGCGDDVFVAKLQGPLVGINEVYLNDQLSLYPNPNTGKFKVDGEGQIIFYNLLGEQVYNEKLNSESNTIDLSAQSKGVYTYKVISSNKQTYTGRVVVQ